MTTTTKDLAPTTVIAAAPAAPPIVHLAPSAHMIFDTVRTNCDLTVPTRGGFVTSTIPLVTCPTCYAIVVADFRAAGLL